MLARADTKVRGRYCAKRCGPSRRRVRTASAVVKNFIRQPEKTFQQYLHETDMPKYLGDVRCWVNSGKLMLSRSFSGFDPGTDMGGMEVKAPNHGNSICGTSIRASAERAATAHKEA